MAGVTFGSTKERVPNSSIKQTTVSVIPCSQALEPERRILVSVRPLGPQMHEGI